MSRERFERAVSRAADTYGIDLPGEAVGEYANELASMADSLGTLDPAGPDDDPATDVRKGDDPYNAFAHTFSLPGGEGPLADLALGVKDNTAVAGVPLTCGSAALSYTPSSHATVVQRLLDAGADVRATTNMDEFASFTTGETCAHGPIVNPAVEGGVPGGSSSGSAAAVAAGDLDAALGTDTGGSVRIPASYCGVVGLKPTHRSVSRFGVVDLAPSLDHVGVLGSSVETTSRVFEAVAGPDLRDPSTLGLSRPDVTPQASESVDDYRVGVVSEAMEDADEAVREQIEAATGELADAGVGVQEVSLPTFGAAPLAFAAVAYVEFARVIADDGQVYGAGTGASEGLRAALADMDVADLGGVVTNQLLVGGGLLETDGERHYVAAQRVREALTAEVDSQLETVDALVLPTTPTTAPDFGTVTDDTAFVRTVSHTVPFNFTGHPALSVPCGTVENRPVGCQLVGGWHEESTVLALGSVVEGIGG